MSALADGILSGFSTVAAFGQQQTQNKLSRDKLSLQRENFEEQTRQYDQDYETSQATLKLAEQRNTREQGTFDQDTAKNNLKVTQEANGRLVADVVNQGWVDATNPTLWDTKQAVEMINTGGQLSDDMILQFANRDTDVPKGFKADTVDRTEGGIIISGKYADGSKGVFTVDGKVSNDSEVATMSPEILSGLMSIEYTGNVLSNSDMGQSTQLAQFLAAQSVGKADSAHLAAKHTAQATLQTKVMAGITEASKQLEEAERVGMKRSFKVALASAETPEDRMAMLTEQAELMGIEVPEILSAAPKQADKNSIEGRLASAGITPAEWAEMSEVEKEEALGQTAKDNKNIKQAAIAAVTGIGEYDEPVARITMAQATDSFTAIADQSAEVKKAAEELQSGMFSQIDGMTPEEVIEYIDGGGFKSSGEDEAKLAKVLQEAQVETMADVERLPTTAQIATRAWLYSIAPDGLKSQLAKEITNIGTGGTAASNRRELDTQNVLQQNANSSTRNAQSNAENSLTSRGTLQNNQLKRMDALRTHDWNVSETIGTGIQKAFEDLNKGIYVLDSDNKPTSEIDYDEQTFFKAMSGPTGSLSLVQKMFDKAEAGSPAKAELRSATNSLYSIGIQVMAESEDYGSFGEMLPDGEINFIDGNDRFLARVFVAERDKYGPTKFGIRSLGSNTQLEETIPAGRVKSLFGNEGFEDFVKQLTVKK